ncbi:MAG TPA: glycosyltransferase family 4 protein [Caulobacteraceae bacterium]|nr:glycosyltransferase family 4 protein [Caulobacteraceae bacterium]
MTGSSPRTRVGFAVFRLAPAGGLEQHALRLAGILVGRGCPVTVITTRPPATAPPGVTIETIEPRGRTNHGRLAAFAADAAAGVAGRFDRTVAFHAIPGFDAIFCADPSRAAPAGWRRWAPRYRTYAALERRALASADLVLMLSTAQLEAFARHHPAARPRLRLLPPTVDRKRAAAGVMAEAKTQARAALGLAPRERVWLWLGLQAHTKGLDRALAALAAVPDARLLVCGLDPAGRGGAAMGRLAERLGVSPRVRWLGFVDDAALGRAMAAADLLVHPSRADVTGTVILESMANGLPVVTTAVCGYGEHVTAAGAGVVLPEPFAAEALAAALAGATPVRLADWSQRALAYAGRDELYAGLERAADLILAAGRDP